MPRSLFPVALASLLAGVSLAAFGASAAPTAAAAAAGAPPGFTSSIVNVNGVRLHIVRGGSGPALILIHGFPQDWSEYRALMPRLAKRYTVVALDLPGIGRSGPSAGGYDADTLARDVDDLAKAQKLNRAFVVGHDFGGQVAYAFARRYPSDTRGTLLMDSPIPGLEGWSDVERDPSVWHVHFFQTPGLPEKLLAGRQNALLDYFFQFGKFTPADEASAYAAYGSDGHMAAALAIYRAMPANGRANAAAKGRDDTPLTIATGDKSPFAKLIPKMAAGVRAVGFTHVDTATVPNSVHYLTEDNPDGVAALIESRAGK
ncbi:MAG TPA: alpha/beta hydrolase [Caulobacteraceae bacterium]|jgi:pimeloyl-ACP methyl ester carboxylesterase